jgi:hypothetical protein
MGKVIKMREQELGYLRNELNQNLKFSSEHTHRLVGQIMLLWGGVLALFGIKQENFTGNIFMGDLFAFYIIATIFFISVAVLYFFSFRNLESLQTIYKIAAYITIFYEKRPSDEKDGKIFWELANFEITKKNMAKSNGKQDKKLNIELDKILSKKLNKEYFYLSIIAFCVIIAIFIKSLFLFDCLANILKIPESINASNVLAIVCFLYIAISGCLLFEIYKNSFSYSKKWLDVKKYHLKSFMEYAIETEHYTEEEAKERFGEDFYNEIYNSEQRISS